MEKTKNNITEIVFILDKSGSMAGLESDTIGGFNALIEKQKKQEGECFVTTVLFNNESKFVYDRIELSEVEPMTEKDYYVGGCTALIDAIGTTVKHIETVHKYIRLEDVPAHTMFVITTDGLENASHIYSSDEVKRMIEQKKEKDGWEFLFVGANIDSVETAKKYGIDSDRAVNYYADGKGTGVLYETISNTVCNVRKNMKISPAWSQKISEDFENRKKNS